MKIIITKHERYLGIIILVGVAFVGLTLYYLWTIQPGPCLIIAGGGSVKKYIEEKTMDKTVIDKFPNSVYINMPSGDAWKLLDQEMEKDKPSYMCVCLSAAKLNPAEIKYRPNAKIIGDSIGVDSLIVYTSPQIKISNSDTVITVEQLVKVLASKQDSKYTIYTTKPNSGTLLAYERILPKLKEKEVYLYFVANANKQNVYEVRKPIVEFLEKIGEHTHIREWEAIEKGGNISKATEFIEYIEKK